jgi:mRNA interferase RelE/StbE
MSSKRPLRVPDDILLLVRGLHPDLKRKIRAGLDALVKEPETGKALLDDLEGFRSFRVGRFRIIYRVGRDLIEIVAIGPRRTIYEETLKRLQQEKTGPIKDG